MPVSDAFCVLKLDACGTRTVSRLPRTLHSWTLSLQYLKGHWGIIFSHPNDYTPGEQWAAPPAPFPVAYSLSVPLLPRSLHD